jgi:hypothetical protein
VFGLIQAKNTFFKYHGLPKNSSIFSKLSKLLHSLGPQFFFSYLYIYFVCVFFFQWNQTDLGFKQH